MPNHLGMIFRIAMAAKIVHTDKVNGNRDCAQRSSYPSDILCTLSRTLTSSMSDLRCRHIRKLEREHVVSVFEISFVVIDMDPKSITRPNKSTAKARLSYKPRRRVLRDCHKGRIEGLEINSSDSYSCHYLNMQLIDH